MTRQPEFRGQPAQGRLAPPGLVALPSPAENSPPRQKYATNNSGTNAVTWKITKPTPATATAIATAANGARWRPRIRATAIPSLALPMSIVATFAVMYLLGYSLDNMSLMALTLAVGFVVDDAIVVLENIVRHIERGESVLDAAIHGSREITFTVISMTISLVAVFIPVLFLGGLIGRLLGLGSAGWILSIIGAMLLLWLVPRMKRAAP